jgi:hypothetical protein
MRIPRRLIRVGFALELFALARDELSRLPMIEEREPMEALVRPPDLLGLGSEIHP